MQKVKIKESVFVKYIDNTQIMKAISDVAHTITNDYKDSPSAPIMLITLSGAMPFATYLGQELGVDAQWAFVKCSSYGCSMKSGELKINMATTIPLEGRDVIVIEDIIDTGKTWVKLHDYCLENGANSVKIATLSIKRDVYKQDLNVDYVALDIVDKFVVGFGLDYDQYGRNLKHIYKLDSQE